MASRTGRKQKVYILLREFYYEDMPSIVGVYSTASGAKAAIASYVAAELVRVGYGYTFGKQWLASWGKEQVRYFDIRAIGYNKQVQLC